MRWLSAAIAPNWLRTLPPGAGVPFCGATVTTTSAVPSGISGGKASTSRCSGVISVEVRKVFMIGSCSGAGRGCDGGRSLNYSRWRNGGQGARTRELAFTTTAGRHDAASLRHNGGWQMGNGSTARPKRTNGRRAELAGVSRPCGQDFNFRQIVRLKSGSRGNNLHLRERCQFSMFPFPIVGKYFN